jgi:outer membrane protein assembly factor BamA
MIKQKIEVVRNSPVEDDRPLPNVSIRFSGDLDSLPAVQQALLRRMYTGQISRFSIRQHLHRLYASGDYSEVRADIRHDDSATVVTLHAVLNTRLAGVVFFNNSVVSSDTLCLPFKSLEGKRINASESSEALEKVIGLYRDRGYALAQIDSISFDTSNGIASIWIDEGRIMDRKIEGNVKTKLFVIFRELLIEEGEPFTIDKAVQSITNVISTNLFEQVMLLIRYENRKPVLVIKVQERSSELLQLGVHVDNERGLQFFVDARDANFLGTATELGATFAGGIRNQAYKLEYKSNRIFDTYLSFNLSGYYRFKDINMFSDESGLPFSRWNRLQSGEYRETKYGSAFRLGAQLERLGNVTVEGRYEQHEIRDKSGTGATAGYSPSRYVVSALRIGSTVDTQDKYPFPADGILMTLFYEFASTTLGSDVPFTKIFLSYEQFRTPGKYFTLHPRVMFGFADETLPLSEQFTFGGQMYFNGLHDDDNRGRQIFLFNLEARWLSPIPLLFDTYLSLRYDVGSVWRVAEDIRFKDFQHGLGATLSLDTPIGPAEFGVGRSFIFRQDLPENPVSLGPFLFYATVGCRL